jgi:hypothetical protein
MRKMTIVFVSAVSALVAGTSLATSSNAQDLASDQAYCRKLVEQYTMGDHSRGPNPQSLELSVAIDQCRSGNPTQAIPVLEKGLRDAGFDVPPRT